MRKVIVLVALAAAVLLMMSARLGAQNIDELHEPESPAQLMPDPEPPNDLLEPISPPLRDEVGGNVDASVLTEARSTQAEPGRDYISRNQVEPSFREAANNRTPVRTYQYRTIRYVPTGISDLRRQVAILRKEIARRPTNVQLRKQLTSALVSLKSLIIAEAAATRSVVAADEVKTRQSINDQGLKQILVVVLSLCALAVVAAAAWALARQRS